MGAMFSCIFKLCDVRMRIALTCFVKQGPPLKEVGFWGGGVIKGKSAKEKLNGQRE